MVKRSDHLNLEDKKRSFSVKFQEKQKFLKVLSKLAVKFENYFAKKQRHGTT